jgi:hypothetical protein
MTEAVPATANGVGTLALTGASLQAQLAALRDSSADRFDPVQFHFMQAMLRRAEAHTGSARDSIESRLRNALHTYQQRFERSLAEAAVILEQLSAHSQAVSGQAQSLFAAREFRQLRCLQAQLASSAKAVGLAELASCLDRERQSNTRDKHGLEDQMHRQERDIAATVSDAASQPGTSTPRKGPDELASGRQLRRSQNRSSTRLRVQRAISECPEDAGPLNPQKLVIRALTTMEGLSADYTNRFMTYVDTLLYLQQLDEQSK